MEGREDAVGVVKENTPRRRPLGARWAWAAAAAAVAALLLVRARHDALPAPRDERLAPATAFVAARAQRHLGALTALGPRVAGSYENEVAAVAVLLRAVKDIARAASPHNTVEVDLHRASGAFPLSFFDGMTNVYRDVQSLVVRVGGAGGGGGDSALLLNCHFDTVPGSPGASDDGAGCAVMLEVLRALAASPRPLRHRAVFLFNGAEENIMQGSHAFITQHPWARSVRAFVNIEACGAGGREVLFQAGPRQPWIMEVYAATVPRPYASSVAQELFESGTIPADTDFRIFRDFGKLSGVDLAWSTNGYVYHTHLDTADRVPLGALQHTGDNVLALTHGLLASEKLEFSGDEDEGQPVFFDVLGLFVVCVRPPAAAAAVAATLLLLLLRTRADAHDARRQLYVPASAWLRALGAMGARLALAVGAGLAAGAAPALLLHAAGARLSYYSRPWLLAPLYALPALGAAALALRRLARAVRLGGAAAGGWWAARLAAAALALLWAALLLLCAAKGLRSGFVALHWALLPALLAQPALVLRASEGCKLAWWCVGSVVPMLQTWYLALGSLHMFVPITGRAGTAPLPPDVMMALLTAALSLAACSWLLPLLLAVRGAGTLARAALAVGALAVALVLCTPLGAPYSATTPQRYMVFHTRRTTHHAPGNVTHEDLYWVPHLDANTPSSLKDHVPLLAQAAWRPQECGAWPYCGAPYCLPVAALVARGYWAAAGPPPLAAAVAARLQPLGPRLAALHLHITGTARRTWWWWWRRPRAPRCRGPARWAARRSRARPGAGAAPTSWRCTTRCGPGPGTSRCTYSTRSRPRRRSGRRCRWRATACLRRGRRSTRRCWPACPPGPRPRAGPYTCTCCACDSRPFPKLPHCLAYVNSRFESLRVYKLHVLVARLFLYAPDEYRSNLLLINMTL